jgi:NAD(P) transhydrogenase subunit alpha
MISPIILIIVFVVCTVVGYFIIKNVPSLLHTPLMSGMNALSGVTIVGAISATGYALFNPMMTSGVGATAQVIGCAAIILASVNVFGGFGITHRMLQMFNKKKHKE